MINEKALYKLKHYFIIIIMRIMKRVPYTIQNTMNTVTFKKKGVVGGRDLYAATRASKPT